MTSETSDCSCPIFRLLDLLGKKRVLLILKEIYLWEQTFTGLKRKLNNLNSSSLTQKLDILRNEWYVQRKLISEEPVKIRYMLTSRGQELGAKMMDLVEWSSQNQEKSM